MDFTGKDFVKGIIGYLKEKKQTFVTFEKSTYGDENNIPFSNTFMDMIDTVALSREHTDTIWITVEREDGAVFSGEFDGSEEGEDFEYLFDEVYHYINGADDPEAEDWLETFLTTQAKEKKVYLLMYSHDIKGDTVTREVKGAFQKKENAMSILRDDVNLFLQYDPDLEHYGYTELHDCHGFPYMEDSNPFPEHTASYFLAQEKKDDQGEYMVNWWVEEHNLI